MPDTDTGSQNQNQALAPNSQGSKPAPKRDPVLSARDRLLEEMDAQISERREAENAEFLRGADPRAAAFYAEMQAEAASATVPPVEVQGSTADAGEEAEPITQDAEPAPQPRDDKGRFAVQADGSDPLADYVVHENGKPMFKTVVDGAVRLIPLETARAQLQKHLVADVRLEEVARKRKELTAWETQLRQHQAALTARAQPGAPVDDKTLETEAVEVVRSLVTDSEPVAAKKLAGVFAKIRGATPAVDVKAISREAAAQAKQEIVAESHERALKNGLTEFLKSYPEMPLGSDLFLIADRKTNAIAEEHPTWTPEQVMMEAGNQTRQWVAQISGRPASVTPNVQVSQGRQQVKQSLKPMPGARSVRPAAAPDPNEGTSPQDALAEIRKSRGQFA